MKKKLIFLMYILLIPCLCFAGENTTKSKLIPFASDYETTVTFPAGYAVGDYIEFARVNPIDVGTSGNYEINNNPYVGYLSNFTVDCNTDSSSPRFRIRAINTYGVLEQGITVSIKIHSINFNAGYTPLNASGNDQTVNKFVPMTNDWSLYVGNSFITDGAYLAIKALNNGNVGIGIASPAEKLAVNGNIRAKEIKVETANWPDYVFAPDYQNTSLSELEIYIKANNHLPDMPSAKEAEGNGIALGEMNKALLKKVEELTLHLIEKHKEIVKLNAAVAKLPEMEEQLRKLTQRLAH